VKLSKTACKMLVHTQNTNSVTPYKKTIFIVTITLFHKKVDIHICCSLTFIDLTLHHRDWILKCTFNQITYPFLGWTGSATICSRCWVGTQQWEWMVADTVDQCQKLYYRYTSSWWWVSTHETCRAVYRYVMNWIQLYLLGYLFNLIHNARTHECIK